MSKPHIRNLAVIAFALVFFAATIPTVHAQIGLDFLNLPAGAKIGPILSRFYVFGVSMTAIAALIMFTIGGVRYMITGGDRDPGPAKEQMKNALFGLILALTSYLILYTINPDLVQEIQLKDIIDLKEMRTAPTEVTFDRVVTDTSDGISPTEQEQIDQIRRSCDAMGGQQSNITTGKVREEVCQIFLDSTTTKAQLDNFKAKCQELGGKPRQESRVSGSAYVCKHE